MMLVSTPIKGMLCTILRVIDMSLFEHKHKRYDVSCLMLLSFEFIFTEKRHRSVRAFFPASFLIARSLLDHHLKASIEVLTIVF